MKPTVITFTTMKQFDRLMQWASRENLVWCSGTHPDSTPRTIRDSVQEYLRRENECALCVDENSWIGYGDAAFFRQAPSYSHYDIKTAQEILDIGIDCTIPEEKETT